MMSANVCHWLHLRCNEHMDIFVPTAERETTHGPDTLDSLGLIALLLPLCSRPVSNMSELGPPHGTARPGNSCLPGGKLTNPTPCTLQGRGRSHRNKHMCTTGLCLCLLTGLGQKQWLRANRSLSSAYHHNRRPAPFIRKGVWAHHQCTC